uniref:WAP domain-containing protein n=1 Tax=Cyprinus carpio TaxID=7962 RepID=A0A8C1RU39_CYPCA
DKHASTPKESCLYFDMKPGQCPKPKRVPECAESCFHDGQCPATQKCCPTTCGHVCSPEKHRQNSPSAVSGSTVML